jgi:hypothetical protein
MNEERPEPGAGYPDYALRLMFVSTVVMGE